MSYTPKQIARLDRVFHACGCVREPFFYADWRILPDLDAAKILRDDKGDSRDDMKIMAVTKAVNEKGIPLAAVMLTTEAIHGGRHVTGWIADENDGAKYWKAREGEAFSDLQHFYNDRLIPAFGADFIPDDAEGGIWRQAYAELRGMGHLERYPADFLVWDRNEFYGDNAYFKGRVIFARDWGTHMFDDDMLRAFMSQLSPHDARDPAFREIAERRDALIWLEDGKLRVRDTRPLDRHEFAAELKGLKERLGESRKSNEWLVCSGVSMTIGKAGENPDGKIGGRLVEDAEKQLFFGAPVNQEPVCGALEASPPKFPRASKSASPK